MTSVKTKNIYRIHRIGALFCAASITLAPFIASLGLIAFIASSLIMLIYNRKHIEFDKIHLLLCFPFFIYCLSFTMKYDANGALNMLIRILPVLILPMIISINSKIINNLKVEIIKYYLLGLVLSSLISLFIGIYHFVMYGLDIKYLTYFELAEYISLHPTYYSLFILTGIIFLLFRFKTKVVPTVLMLLLFVIMILLLQSRMAYIILMVVLGFYFYKYSKYFKAYFFPVFITLLLIIIAIPNSVSRLTELSVDYNTEKDLIGDNEENGISQRIWLWSNAWTQIKEKPLFGYGFKSQHTVFKWEIEKENLFINRSYIYDMAAMKLASWNLHNQYITILYESGFLGLLLYLLPIYYLIRYAYLNNNILFLLVYVSFLAFMITENLLDRQMGIYFYAFVLPCLLCSKSS